MDKEAISAMLYSLIALSLLTPVNPNPLQKYCDGTQLSGNNSPFEKNLNILLQSLVSSTPLTGYNHTSFGNGSDRVYGQALCRGDVGAMDCQKCLENASQEVTTFCQRKQAILWYDLCQIRYSSQSFFQMMVYAGKEPDKNYSRENVSRPDQFRRILKEFITRLSDYAAFVDSETMFALGDTKYSKKGKIYGLAQCTRDITKTECRNCLTNALGDLKACCSSKEGGFVFSSSCSVRFDVSPFFNTSSSEANKYKAGQKGKKWKVVVIASCTSSALAILICSCAVYLWWNKESKQDEVKSQSALLPYSQSPRVITMTDKDDEPVSTEELPFMDLSTICAATSEFSDLNKLGQGGFGSVYKGVLPDGKEVAVKRLSRKSWQGEEEFRNELVLIAKLQHRNLVRLLGCAVEGVEKILVYEFMPNKSLDSFIFDSEKRSLLDWKTRYNIIKGIARGLLYLHEDSRLRIIHRDLKPSNVLLDNEMVAKISDFGLARIFCEDQNTANTRKVVGTYGYMAPEYAMQGQFSTKSDVFSFGVILLEIINGKKNSSSFLDEKSQTLIRYAWQLWREGKELEFVDPLMESSPIEDVVRCMQIGLLCVQEDPADRPTMSTVVALLGSGTISLPQPRQPAFSVPKVITIKQSSITNNSVTGLTVSSASSTTQP
ncbi:Mitogen-activated protein kinase kinase kinase [Parasponia andersonii]|uniref:non-specific serine/threonine protein kinase n=1 Tax=Parasponia andersonii TaxID=3476 RepID=A0A2P5AX21_PARAD|nr:Mitogen-activated protein kinase kinase kinase [Parasponia andersonii]